MKSIRMTQKGNSQAEKEVLNRQVASGNVLVIDFGKCRNDSEINKTLKQSETVFNAISADARKAVVA